MLRIASIGECMVELRHRSPAELTLAFGGDTLNFAVYLARLTREQGIEVDYVGALGDDAYSDAMLAMWRAERIGTGLVARLKGRLPGLYTIRTDIRGERSFTYWRSASAAREMLGVAGRSGCGGNSAAMTCSTFRASRFRSWIPGSAMRCWRLRIPSASVAAGSRSTATTGRSAGRTLRPPGPCSTRC